MEDVAAPRTVGLGDHAFGVGGSSQRVEDVAHVAADPRGSPFARLSNATSCDLLSLLSNNARLPTERARRLTLLDVGGGRDRFLHPVTTSNDLWMDPRRRAGALELQARLMLVALEAAAKVIDMGAGAGWFAASLAGAGLRRGVESRTRVRRARERFPGLGSFSSARDRCRSRRPRSTAPGWRGAEHVADVVGLLTRWRGVLAPGGRLALSTPAHGLETEARAGSEPAGFERHFEPRADHLRFFTAARSRLLEAAASRQIASRTERGPARYGAGASRAEGRSGGALGERPNVT